MRRCIDRQVIIHNPGRTLGQEGNLLDGRSFLVERHHPKEGADISFDGLGSMMQPSRNFVIALPIQPQLDNPYFVRLSATDPLELPSCVQ